MPVRHQYLYPVLFYQMTLHIHRNVTDAGAGTHDQQHRAKFKQGATQGK